MPVSCRSSAAKRRKNRICYRGHRRAWQPLWLDTHMLARAQEHTDGAGRVVRTEPYSMLQELGREGKPERRPGKRLA